MRRLTDDERKMYAEKMRDLAHIGAGAMVFGQFLAETKFNVWLSLGRVAFWIGCFWVSHLIYSFTPKED